MLVTPTGTHTSIPCLSYRNTPRQTRENRSLTDRWKVGTLIFVEAERRHTCAHRHTVTLNKCHPRVRWRGPAGPAVCSLACASVRSRCCSPAPRSRRRRPSGWREPPAETSARTPDTPAHTNTDGFASCRSQRLGRELLGFGTDVKRRDDKTLNSHTNAHNYWSTTSFFYV